MPQQNTAIKNMITGQIMTGDVNETSIINAMGSVDRSVFVPGRLGEVAYIDKGIALGNDRFLLEPLVFARMLKYANIAPHETVLDVGCTTGYSAAVISKLAQKVVALEEDNSLAEKAKTLLASYSNIECVEGALGEGANPQSPYHVIFIEGAVQFLPQKLSDQLCEGGRLLTVEHLKDAKTAASGLGKLVEYKKIHNTLYKTTLHDANACLIESFRKPATFVL